MATIDDRVVSMAFENTKFISGVSSTLSSLDKLNAALKKAGTDNGLDQIEKSANKISFGGLSSAIDKIKGKFGAGIPEAATAFSDVEKGSGKVTLNPLATALDKIKGKFHFPEADQAFSAIEKSSGRVTFTGLTQAIDGLGRQFGILEGAASVALGNIMTRGIQAGAGLAKSLTFEPVTGGFKEYETQLNAVQTILSNTKASGAGLKDVNASLSELNTYADKTIYNFTEMAKNIGTFTAAGVDLKTATGSIKGIANLAALSGSNSQQASTAMYQLSQAISAGRVSLQDWNSVVNAGMGGTVFQRALAQTAEKMGTLDKGAVELKGKMKNVTIEGKSFRESVMAKPGEESWLTSKVLTSTLKQLSGDMTDAQLKAEGFSDAQIDAIQKQAKMAVNAATQVKTLSGLLDTTKEAVGSGWAQTWQIVFGDFGEAKTLFTGLSEAIGGFVGANADARNKVLKDWKELGGRKLLLEGIGDVFRALIRVVAPIKQAFREIFPAKTGRDLFELTEKFQRFADRLYLMPRAFSDLKRTARGFFAALDIGKQLISGVVSVIARLFGELGKGSGGILNMSAELGDLVVKLRDWLKQGDRLKGVFEDVGDALAAPIRLIANLTRSLGGIFSGDASGGATSALSGLGDALTPAQEAANAAKTAWEGFLRIVDRVKDALAPVAQAVAGAFSNFGNQLADAFATSDFSGVFNIIQTGLIAGIFLMIKKALGDGLDIINKGVLGNVSQSLDVLRGSLVDIQRNIQARTLLLIASAVGILAVSVVALSLVKPEKLASSMTAITVAMVQLMGALAILGKASGAMGVVQAPVIASALILIAGAMVILSAAIVILSMLSWEELGRGLAGIAGGMTILALSVKPLSKAAPQMAVAGASLIPIAIGLNLMALAIKQFGGLDWEEMGKGLLGVFVALRVIRFATGGMGPQLLLIGPALIAVGFALGIIAGAVKVFGMMDLETLGKGIGGIALALAAIGLTMGLMPPTLPLTAAGLILVGIALTGIAGAIALMGNMDFGTLAKGIGAIAVSLGVLAAGLTLMIAALPGAAALLVASAALAIFVPVLGILGSMAWGTVAKGLTIVALSLGVIGVTGAIAAPALIALGVALGVFGLGLLAVSASVYLVAKGVSLLATDGAKGLGVFMAAMTAMVALIPKMIIDFIKGTVDIVASIAKIAPEVAISMGKIIVNILDVIIAAAPRVALATTALITAILTVLAQNAGPIITAGWKLLQQLLSGIANNIGKVTLTVGTIIVRFLNSLASKTPSITAAGLNVLVKFLQGVANNLGRVVTAAANIVTKYIDGIANNISKVVSAGANLVVRLISGITNNLGRITTAGADAIIKFASGLASNFERVATAGVNLVSRLINAVAKNSVKMADEGAKAIIRFLHGVADVIRTREPEMIAAGADVGKAIVQGLINGIADLAPRALEAAANLGKKALKALGKAAHLGSPSTETYKYGGWVVEGFANGIAANTFSAMGVAGALGNSVIGKFREVFQIYSPSKVMEDIGKYVGEGFLVGLRGSGDDITNAFTELQGKLTTAISTIKETIRSEEDRLDKLRDAKKPDRKAILETQQDIDTATNLLKRSRDAHKELTTALRDEKAELLKLAKDYEGLSEKLKAAEDVLESAKKTRDDAFGTYRDQYSALPDIDPEAADQLGTYTTALANQAVAVKTYKETLDQLRTLGLDDATYQKLLTEGTANQQFASQLLAGGKTAVDSLNTLDSQLMGVSSTLASNAANNLYQAGVDAATGLVNGIKSQQNELRKTMEAIATEMIKAIKKKLKVKSPSKEMEKIGRFSSLGVAKGLRSASKPVADAAGDIGDDALVAMRSSMAQVSEAMSTEIDSNPTITPILDLTEIQKGAKQMSKMTNVVPITTASSYGLAALVDLARATSEDDSETAGTPMVKFEQNNYSPESLSEAEIYRQTNNQLSQGKKLLGLT